MSRCASVPGKPHEATSLKERHEMKSGFTFDPATRTWIYGIVTAALALAGVYFGVDAVVQGQWANLAAAILNLSAAGATDLARRNVTDNE